MAGEMWGKKEDKGGGGREIENKEGNISLKIFVKSRPPLARFRLSTRLDNASKDECPWDSRIKKGRSLKGGLEEIRAGQLCLSVLFWNRSVKGGNPFGGL
jgi:hypothetical protein